MVFINTNKNNNLLIDASDVKCCKINNSYIIIQL